MTIYELINRCCLIDIKSTEQMLYWELYMGIQNDNNRFANLAEYVLSALHAEASKDTLRRFFCQLWVLNEESLIKFGSTNKKLTELYKEKEHILASFAGECLARALDSGT